MASQKDRCVTWIEVIAIEPEEVEAVPNKTETDPFAFEQVSF
jgi:hypothetical protein